MLLLRVEVNAQWTDVHKNLVSFNFVRKHGVSLRRHYNHVSEFSLVKQLTEVSLVYLWIFERTREQERLLEVGFNILQQCFFSRFSALWLVDIMNQVVVNDVHFALCPTRLQAHCGWIARELDHALGL